jgi:hypothetical protein
VFSKFKSLHDKGTDEEQKMFAFPKDALPLGLGMAPLGAVICSNSSIIAKELLRQIPTDVPAIVSVPEARP